MTLPDGRRNIRRDKMISVQMAVSFKIENIFLTFGIQVEKRSGKKTVTLLSNTSFFGLDPKAFAKKLQVSLATGVTTNDDVPNCEGPQIQLSGNHVSLCI